MLAGPWPMPCSQGTEWKARRAMLTPMLAATGRTAPFVPARWTECVVNVPLGAEHAGVHDVYTVDLSLRSGEDREVVRALAVEALFRYRIFPTARMRAMVCTDDGRIGAGATIIQRVFLGAVCLEMAVRIVDTFG